jgi:hypothetical protein
MELSRDCADFTFLLRECAALRPFGSSGESAGSASALASTRFASETTGAMMRGDDRPIAEHAGDPVALGSG